MAMMAGGWLLVLTGLGPGVESVAPPENNLLSSAVGDVAGGAPRPAAAVGGHTPTEAHTGDASLVSRMPGETPVMRAEADARSEDARLVDGLLVPALSMGAGAGVAAGALVMAAPGAAALVTVVAISALLPGGFFLVAGALATSGLVPLLAAVPLLASAFPAVGLVAHRRAGAGAFVRWSLLGVGTTLAAWSFSAAGLIAAALAGAGALMHLYAWNVQVQSMLPTGSALYAYGDPLFWSYAAGFIFMAVMPVMAVVGGSLVAGLPLVVGALAWPQVLREQRQADREAQDRAVAPDPPQSPTEPGSEELLVTRSAPSVP